MNSLKTWTYIYILISDSFFKKNIVLFREHCLSSGLHTRTMNNTTCIDWMGFDASSSHGNPLIQTDFPPSGNKPTFAVGAHVVTHTIGPVTLLWHFSASVWFLTSSMHVCKLALLYVICSAKSCFYFCSQINNLLFYIRIKTPKDSINHSLRMLLILTLLQ